MLRTHGLLKKQFIEPVTYRTMSPCVTLTHSMPDTGRYPHLMGRIVVFKGRIPTVVLLLLPLCIFFFCLTVGSVF